MSIDRDDWLPADWRVERRTDKAGNETVIVYRPNSTAGISMGEALILRDILCTRSRIPDRRLQYEMAEAARA